MRLKRHLLCLALLINLVYTDNAPFLGNLTVNGVIPLEIIIGTHSEDQNGTTNMLETLQKFKTAVVMEEPILPVQGVLLQTSAKQMSSLFRIISNEELGVTTMQEIYDSLPYEALKFDPSEKLKDITQKVRNKLLIYGNIVNQNRLLIEELFRHHLLDPLSGTLPCCELPEKSLRYDDHFGLKISEETACDVSLPSRQLFAFSPGRNLSYVFASNLRKAPGLKWQYFIGSDGAHCEYPAFGCRSVETDFRTDIYVSTIYPQPKVIVVLVDHGSAMSSNQLSIAKALGKYFVSSLSDRDRVGLVAVSNDMRQVPVESCANGGFALATLERKFQLSRFLDSLERAEGPANHTLAIATAFQMIKTLFSPNDISNCQSCTDLSCEWKDVEPVILYISRGLLMSLAERGSVLDLVAQENHCLGGKVTINTYPVIDDGKPIMYEKSFLYDLAQQNHGKTVAADGTPLYQVRRGQMVAVNSTRNLSATLGYFYRSWNATVATNKVAITSAFADPIGKGLVVSLSLPCYHIDHLLGVTGVDLSLEDLLEDSVYPGNDGDSYSFVVDLNGFVIYHPLFGRPGMASEQPAQTDVKFLERHADFLPIRKRIVAEISGYASVLISKNVSGVASEDSKLYTWQRVTDFPLIVCVVSFENEQKNLIRLRMVPTPDVVYHRLDLVSASSTLNVCQQFKRASTLDAASLFLPASCFVSPFKFLRWGEASTLTVQSYLAYLADNTKLIANPGLRSNVRSDVGAAIQIAPRWKAKVMGSRMSRFIVRRYLAAKSGVYLEYPGSLIPQNMDPTRSPWYMRAMELPGRVVVTGPWLDPSGVGYIVTLSHTLYEGKPAALHGASDPVVAVIGADFRHSYLYRILQEAIPFCPPPSSEAANQIRCFVSDDRGYVLTHPSLFAAARQKGGVELQHLTHLEPLVASDLLEHEDFVVKKACYSFVDRTIQRFYLMNMSLSASLEDKFAEAGQKLRVLTNLVHGEHCNKYQIAPVPGTNMFVGFVNQTCETVTAFCPCSTVDRLCLNCHRMEQSECECPCECPMELDSCRDEVVDSVVRDNCPSEYEQPRNYHIPSVSELGFDYLEQCLHLDCGFYGTETDCLGVVGCEWCYLYPNGEARLRNPYCSIQQKCFAGVKDGLSPYIVGSQELLMETPPTGRQTQIGPVVGGIVAVIIVVAMAVYCYRQHVGQESSVYLAHLTEGNVRMTDVDDEEINNGTDGVAGEEATAVQQDIRLIELDNLAAMSPYRVNTRYRRPPASESDHGYSTMTPHDDSEHTISFHEPLLIGRDRHRPAQPTSVSSRASSPLGMPVRHPKALAAEVRSLSTAQSTTPEEEDFSVASGTSHPYPTDSMGMTALPPNVIEVPVIVHRVDTS